MDISITLVKLAGSVALLLWGVHMVQTGVQRALGARLRSLLGLALRNRAQAFLAGIGVTAILQSSTATGLMVTGFAAGGLVDLVPALAVMLAPMSAPPSSSSSCPSTSPRPPPRSSSSAS